MKEFGNEQPSEIKQLFRFFFKKHALLFCMIVVLFLLVAFISMIRPIGVGYMVHDGYALKNVDVLMHYIKMLFMISLAIMLFSAIRAFFYTKIEVKILYQLQAIVMRRIVQLPVCFFDQYTTGDLVHRILWITSLSHWFSSTQMGLFLSFLSLLISFCIMFYFDWQLTVLVFTLISLITAFSVWTSVRHLPRLEAHAKDMGHAYGFMLQVLHGISRIKLFAKEPFIDAIWSKIYGGARQNLQRIYDKGVLGYAFFYSAPLLFLLVIFNAATLRLDTILPQHFMIFFLSLGLLIGSMVSFYINASGFIDALIAYRRVQPILQTSIEQGHTFSTRIPAEELFSTIHINNVSFCYPDSKRWILRELNCFISRGQHVAFIGLSGSGKSTLLKLLLGFYTPQQGQVEMDGKPLQDVELLKFRSNIGVVLQDSQFMPGSILENIISHTNATEEDAWQVLASLGLDAFIMGLPMGIHTAVSQHINLLSGGQKQLLFIARALMGAPQLLLLDEATNSLDNQAQEMVMNRIDQLKITRITIAHRLSTIRNVDKIFVLDQGKIVEAGDYQHLMDEKGLFYQLATR